MPSLYDDMRLTEQVSDADKSGSQRVFKFKECNFDIFDFNGVGNITTLSANAPIVCVDKPLETMLWHIQEL
jgi:hypothetical protein